MLFAGSQSSLHANTAPPQAASSTYSKESIPDGESSVSMTYVAVAGAANWYTYSPLLRAYGLHAAGGWYTSCVPTFGPVNDLGHAAGQCLVGARHLRHREGVVPDPVMRRSYRRRLRGACARRDSVGNVALVTPAACRIFTTRKFGARTRRVEQIQLRIKTGRPAIRDGREACPTGEVWGPRIDVLQPRLAPEGARAR